MLYRCRIGAYDHIVILINMSAQIRRYIREKEDFQFKRGYTPEEVEASKLRKEFLRQFVINFDTHLYKTQPERDWSYLAKREFNYDVRLKGAGYAFMICNVLMSWRIYVNKAMVWWPVLTIPLSYAIIAPMLLQKHNKKIFDMCNVGEQYHLGLKRNEVLRECNRILDREDF